MVACGAKIVLQLVVGAWDIRLIVAMEQTRPIAGGDFAKRGEHGGEGLRGRRRVLHFRQERFVGLTYLCCRELVDIGENMGSTMHPGISLRHIRPQCGCFCESFCQKKLHAF